MRRRRKRPDSEANLDSLMDALTNVVAVLILILVLVRVDVINAVERILGDLRPATQEEVDLAGVELEGVRERIERLRALMDTPDPTEEELRAMEGEIRSLEESIEESRRLAAGLDPLREQVSGKQQLVEEEKARTVALRTEVVRLEELLDETPVLEPELPMMVRIPDSRPIPENARMYYCYIRGDQLHLIEPEEALELAMRRFGAQRNLMVHSRDGDNVVYDQEKVVQFFEEQELTYRKQRLRVPYNRPWTSLHLDIHIDPGDGDASYEDMKQAGGRVHRMFELVASRRNAVLIFRVDPAGFETYVRAREIADAYRIPSGWEVDTGNRYRMRLPIRVNRLEQPAPRPPPTGEPSPPPPPVPGVTLD